jgi:hypothetical protein
LPWNAHIAPCAVKTRSLLPKVSKAGDLIGEPLEALTGGIPTINAAADEPWFTPEFRQRVAQRMGYDTVSYAAAYSVLAISDSVRIPRISAMRTSLGTDTSTSAG